VVVTQLKFSLYFALPGSPLQQTLLMSNEYTELSFCTAMNNKEKKNTKKGVGIEQIYR
jgi:hypothetical protein